MTVPVDGDEVTITLTGKVSDTMPGRPGWFRVTGHKFIFSATGDDAAIRLSAPQAAGVGERVAKACADFQEAIDDFEAEVADVMAEGSERADLWDREVTVNIDALKAVMNAALRAPSREPEGGMVQWGWRIRSKPSKSPSHRPWHWQADEPTGTTAELCEWEPVYVSLAARKEAPAEAGEIECDGCDGDRCVHVGSLCNPAQPQAPASSEVVDGLTVTLIETAPHLPANGSMAIRVWDNHGLRAGTHRLYLHPPAPSADKMRMAYKAGYQNGVLDSDGQARDASEEGWVLYADKLQAEQKGGA